MTSARSVREASRPDGNASSSCRKMPPHSPPMTDPGRVHERDVRQAHRGEEPREAEQHHEHARPALGPAAPGVQPGADEAPTPPPGRRSPRRSSVPGGRSSAPARRRPRRTRGPRARRGACGSVSSSDPRVGGAGTQPALRRHAARASAAGDGVVAAARPDVGRSRPENAIQLTLRRGPAAGPGVGLATASTLERAVGSSTNTHTTGSSRNYRPSELTTDGHGGVPL